MISPQLKTGIAWDCVRELLKNPDLTWPRFWRKFDGEHWSELLRYQPQFAEHCDWSSLGYMDWSFLLMDQPQFRTRKIGKVPCLPFFPLPKFITTTSYIGIISRYRYHG